MFASAQSLYGIDTADYQLRQKFLNDYKTVTIPQLKSTIKSKATRRQAPFLEDHINTIEHYVEELVANKELVYKGEIVDFLKLVVEEIRSKNAIDSKYAIFLKRDNSPNAICLSDGKTIIVNLGLFLWMDNEDQIASIISHEIAHARKQHSIKNVLKIAEEQKEFKKNLKKLKNNEDWDPNENLYAFMKKQRLEEIEADSLGFSFYKNTKFNRIDYKNALSNLSKFDSISPVDLKVEMYRKLYDLPTQKFNEKWMIGEDFKNYNYSNYKESERKDSVATHPELNQRIEKLQLYFSELKADGKPRERTEDFFKFQKLAQEEYVANFFTTKDYGSAIYVAMNLLQEGTEEEKNKMWLGELFSKVLEARKKYTLNKHLDKLNPSNQNESYQRFLNFMWNLRLDEIQKIAKYYKKEP